MASKTETQELREDVDLIAQTVRRVEKKVDGLETRFDDLESKFEELKVEVAEIPSSVAAELDKRIGMYVETQAEQLLGGKRDHLIHLSDKVDDHEKRIAVLEQ